MRVWICQALCGSERHCMAAAAGEAPSREAAIALLELPLRDRVNASIAAGGIEPICGLCLAPAATWRYETCRTGFRTLAAATPTLRRLERTQRRASLPARPRRGA